MQGTYSNLPFPTTGPVHFPHLLQLFITHSSSHWIFVPVLCCSHLSSSFLIQLHSSPFLSDSWIDCSTSPPSFCVISTLPFPNCYQSHLTCTNLLPHFPCTNPSSPVPTYRLLSLRPLLFPTFLYWLLPLDSFSPDGGSQPETATVHFPPQTQSTL